MATKTVYLQHEQQHERWGQAWHKLHQQQWHEHRHAQVAQPVSTARRARSLRLLICDTCTSWLKVFLSLTSSHRHTWASLLDLAFLPFYLDLSFPVFFHFTFVMHSEQRTELDNLITMQHNLRTSAKGSNDAYDVHTSLTKKKRVRIKNGETRAIPKYWNGCKKSQKILWMTEFLNTKTHTPVLLMNHLRNLWEVWIWVSTVFKLTSLKTEIARSARGPKLQGPRAEDALAEPYVVQKILVI